MSDRKRPRDESNNQPSEAPRAGQAGDERTPLASLPSNALSSSPGHTFRRLRQGNRVAAGGGDGPPSSGPPSSDPGLNGEDELGREDEDALRRLDDALDAAEEVEEEEDGEDLFGEGMEADYRPNAVLDRYDAGELDEANYESMTLEQRREVERRMARRDREETRRRGGLGKWDEEDQEDEFYQRRLRRRHGAPAAEGEMELDAEEPVVTIEEITDLKGSNLFDYISQEGIRQYFMMEFQRFLTQFLSDKDEPIYAEKIKTMCEKNGESLEVSYLDLYRFSPVLSYIVSNAPSEALKMFDQVAMEVVLDVFENYDDIRSEVHVRIVELPHLDELRDLRQIQLNTIVRVQGVVTRRTGVFPQLKYVKYDCGKCGAVLGPFYQDTTNELRIGNCPQCESKGPFLVNAEQTVYRNYQKMTLQESPGTVPPGRLPRTREVILLWDLIDCARPGEEVVVTGIYRNNFDSALNTRNGFPVFATVIEANHVEKKEDQFASFRLTEEDERDIQRLARDERIGQRIIKSVAPSIYGHDDVKTAVALALFGGVPKNPQNKHRIRGDINLLLLGDPGTAKSQILKYVEKTAHRAVYTTGQGASAVGLTASVRKDPVTREWTLEGGALVLADKGVCLIDEFDKMNDQDRTSIHEAMEQQSISISKAGIVTTLQARCTVVAAANPVRGRYDPRIPLNANVELTEPILSRFDILCVVQDRPDPVVDGLLADFVIDSHVRSHPTFDGAANKVAKPQDADIIPQDLLKKYIMYARTHVRPKITSIDSDRLASVYAELRRASLVGDSIPITVRHLESMIRMSEANAKMHLREDVRADDVDIAIRTMVESFVKAQKYSVRRQMQKQFSRYINYQRDQAELLNHVLSDLVRDHLKYHHFRNKDTDLPEELEMDTEDFEARARELNIFDVRPFYTSALFRSGGFRFDAAKRQLIKSF
ncbi:MCM-domain-containing protein [Gonapodya prolifera JEL478]|uniref:DNA replication licensing factor MCM2 n=1 Tax=Gonapodya prolifera (strain JEL478) TaxID=1344416 RepID=A0A139ATM1_GONPJ|nr:MCM-domain-containing protein [Gonapodya prolifera JEL478]|eukprot:KXS20072.1 MCM-domain-containing protein [Gonapodya prolifera JEL478]